MGGGRRALSTLPRKETCRPPLCHFYGADRRDAKEPAARQLEWRVASEQEVTTLRPVGRISAGQQDIWSSAIVRSRRRTRGVPAVFGEGHQEVRRDGRLGV